MIRPLSEAVGECDEFVSFLLENFDGMRYDLIHSLSINIVVERQDGARMLCCDVGIKLLALVGCHADRVARIEVPQGDLLPALRRNLTDAVVVLAVRRAHERGIHADDSLQRLVEERELAVDLVRVQRGEVLV